MPSLLALSDCLQELFTADLCDFTLVVEWQDVRACFSSVALSYMHGNGLWRLFQLHLGLLLPAGSSTFTPDSCVRACFSSIAENCMSLFQLCTVSSCCSLRIRVLTSSLLANEWWPVRTCFSPILPATAHTRFFNELPVLEPVSARRL